MNDVSKDTDESLEEEIVEDEKEEATEVSFGQPSVEELSEMLDSVKINEGDDDIKVEAVDKKALKSPVKEGEIDSETLALYEEFGQFLEVKADITADEGVKVVIPTGIDVLDAALGGGFPVGAMTIIVGNPGSGKSMLAIQTMGAAQKKFRGCITSYLDSEEATTTLRLSNLGVRNPPIKPIIDITVEKMFKLLETMCLFKEKKKIEDIPSIVCWDSIANTLSQKEREVEDINSVIGYKARLLSILVPKYVARCSKYGIAWICVNQLRDEMTIGQFAKAKELKFMTTGKSMPGGNVLKFNAFTLLELKTGVILEPEKFGFEGMLFTAITVKNKLMPPNIKIEIVGDYVRGFNNFRTSYHFLMKNKRLVTGPWNYIKSDPEKKKFRVKDAESLYNSDEAFRGEFDKAVKEAIQVEIIDKYNPEVK